MRRLMSLIALLLTLLSVPARAQLIACHLPDSLPQSTPESPRPGEVLNARPTQYVLALSWSPQFCRSRGSDPKFALQCNGEAGHFGFILHGFWPDVAGKSDPAWCGPAQPLPASLIRQHLCMTPSAQLMTHEWAKHGTCASSDPEKYFKAASLLFSALKFPDMESLSRRRITIAAFASAFSSINPGVRPKMIAVNLDRGSWLKEVRLCLDSNLKPHRCAREDWGDDPSRFLKVWQADALRPL